MGPLMKLKRWQIVGMFNRLHAHETDCAFSQKIEWKKRVKVCLLWYDQQHYSLASLFVKLI